jgi:hypothetical protein
MVLQLVAIQFHDGSGDRENNHWSLQPKQITSGAFIVQKHSTALQLGTH